MASPIERRAEVSARRAQARDYQTIFIVAPIFAVTLFGAALLARGMGARAAETPAPSPTPSSVPEATWTPTQRGFPIATPIPSISRIVALDCQGLTAFSDANLGALTREGPGREFKAKGPGIPAGSSVDLDLVAQVILSDGTEAFYAITENSSGSSPDGTTSMYTEVAPSNVIRSGLGVNFDLATSCVPVSAEPKP